MQMSRREARKTVGNLTLQRTTSYLRIFPNSQVPQERSLKGRMQIIEKAFLHLRNSGYRIRTVFVFASVISAALFDLLQTVSRVLFIKNVSQFLNLCSILVIKGLFIKDRRFHVGEKKDCSQ